MEYKLVVLGTGGVGKSSLIIQLVSYQFVEDYDPTVEDSYRKRVCIDYESCLLDILDTAGFVEFNPMRDHYLKTVQGALLVYSITSKTSFEDLVSFREQVIRATGTNDIPIVLVGNKKDLEDNRQVTTKEAQDLAASWRAPFFEASAKLRENVEEAFFDLVREIRKRSPRVPPTKKKCALV